MPTNTFIPDPHESIPNRILVQSWTDPKVFRFFFRACFAGERGPRQAMINTFLQKFYEACVLNGIPPVYDEESAPKVAEILTRLNFVAPKVKKEKTK